MNLSQTRLSAFIQLYPQFFKQPISWFIENWDIVKHFENVALDLIYAGRDHYSARTIVEVMVHESILRENSSKYKIGNQNAPDLARVFVVLHPEYINFWEYRREDHIDFRRVVSDSALVQFN
jgi:hypothetical protein